VLPVWLAVLHGVATAYRRFPPFPFRSPRLHATQMQHGTMEMHVENETEQGALFQIRVLTKTAACGHVRQKVAIFGARTSGQRLRSWKCCRNGLRQLTPTKPPEPMWP
jgi:hypothetical protein